MRVIVAKDYKEKYPNNIIVGGILTVSYEDEENLIIEGFNNKYRDYDPNYLLKWELIEKMRYIIMLLRLIRK